MKRNLILVLSFGCIGVTTEVFFTAIMNAAQQYSFSKMDLSLQGQSYVWMFPIYGFGVLILKSLYSNVMQFPKLLRITIYSMAILVIEFLSGWLLDFITGSCPWEYTEGIHVLGYVRLDYIFFWMLFCFFMEKVFLFINELQLR